MLAIIFVLLVAVVGAVIVSVGAFDSGATSSEKQARKNEEKMKKK